MEEPSGSCFARRCPSEPSKRRNNPARDSPLTLRHAEEAIPDPRVVVGRGGVGVGVGVGVGGV